MDSNWWTNGKKVTSEEPWMLEEDYRQAGGQAKIQEEPIATPQGSLRNEALPP